MFRRLEEQVRETELFECNILRRRSKIEWAEKGKTCSKFFFATLKFKQAQEKMPFLKVEGDRQITEEDEILEYVHKYYSALYTQPSISLDEKREQERTLSLVDQLVSEEDNRCLMETPGAEELEHTVKNLPSGKSPRKDRISAEVLKELWEEIGPCCLRFIQEAWISKRIGVSNTRAVIKLLPKNEKKEELKNWRPISLLNLAYKLVGRILANRLKNIIPKLVDEEQTGFNHGRSITDNIVSLGLCQELATALGKPALFYKLDFVKAFDRVQHHFLWATMRRMGFDSAVIELIRALVLEGHAKIHLNGREGEKKGELEGVHIPRGRSLLHQLFADDSGVALNAEEQNFQNLCRVVEIFE
ncbi:hypothetical protein R1flu_023173 [Riccia fluitans]|uniref:Reverse transcriptase domain-containing protein n=1 Tax=Riccia fluitans TaxID=41844 RepID=A0ABD1XRD3_9MARC